MHGISRPFACVESNDIFLLLSQHRHAEIGSHEVVKKALVIRFESSSKREGKSTGVNHERYIAVRYVLRTEYLGLFGELKVAVQRSRRDESRLGRAALHGFHGEYVRE